MDNRIDFLGMACALAKPAKNLQYPLETWQPTDCGPLPLEIDSNGQWWSTDHNFRSPYQRPEIVKLLSALLWCEPQDYDPSQTIKSAKYSLRTPHESVSISVIDTPFLIVDYHWLNEQLNSELICTTSIGEQFTIGAQHPLVLGAQSPHLPYALVRRNLWARLSRNTYYRLIDELLQSCDETSNSLGFTSKGSHFLLTPM